MVYCGCATESAKLRWGAVLCLLCLGTVLVVVYLVQLWHCELCYSDGSACVHHSRWILGPLQDDPDAATRLADVATDESADYSYSPHAPEIGKQSFA